MRFHITKIRSWLISSIEPRTKNSDKKTVQSEHYSTLMRLRVTGNPQGGKRSSLSRVKWMCCRCLKQGSHMLAHCQMAHQKLQSLMKATRGFRLCNRVIGCMKLKRSS